MIKGARSSRARAMPAQVLVSVVDDDESVRESLPDLLRELGFAVQAFASAAEFLTSRLRLCDALPDTGCRDAGHVRTGVAAGIDPSRPARSRSFSSPPGQMRPCASNSSRGVRWSACSSPSVSSSCERLLMRHCRGAEMNAETTPAAAIRRHSSMSTRHNDCEAHRIHRRR